MGGGSKGKDLPHTSLVPESALSADARISDILVKSASDCKTYTRQMQFCDRHLEW